jgi:hypothetical protein
MPSYPEDQLQDNQRVEAISVFQQAMSKTLADDVITRVERKQLVKCSRENSKFDITPRPVSQTSKESDDMQRLLLCRLLCYSKLLRDRSHKLLE